MFNMCHAKTFAKHLQKCFSVLFYMYPHFFANVLQMFYFTSRSYDLKNAQCSHLLAHDQWRKEDQNFKTKTKTIELETTINADDSRL